MSRFLNISRLRHQLFLSLVWIGMILLTNPVGDFPINDDWAYGWSVKQLVEHGVFQLSGWTASNLFGQIIWGAAFAGLFSFSFTVLRGSILVLGLLGAWCAFQIGRCLGIDKKMSLFIGLLIVVNPLYFGLSHTFLNDIPFVAFSLLAVLFLLKGTRMESRRFLILGITAACWTLLTRQTGIVILLAWAIVYMLKHRFNGRSIGWGLAAIGGGLALQWGYEYWLQLNDNLPVKFGNQIDTLLSQLSGDLTRLIRIALRTGFMTLFYLGFFLFPLLLLGVPSWWKVVPRYRRKALLGLGVLLFTSLFALMVIYFGGMPVYGNVLASFGLGPIIMKGVQFPDLPYPLLFSMTLLSVGGATLLPVSLWMGIRRELAVWPENGGRIFLMLMTLIYFAPISLLGFGPFGFYDRYLTFLVPMVALWVAPLHFSGRRPLFFAVVFCIGLYGLFSVMITHDLLAFNRTRWQALNDLTMERQISPALIDGGFEFNAWYLYEDGYDDWLEEPEKSWYWVDRDLYVVSNVLLPGYKVIRRYEYQHWLPWEQRRILVQKKVPAE